MFWKTQLLPYPKGHDLIGFINGFNFEQNHCPLSTICVTIISTPNLAGLGKTYFSWIFLFPLYWMKLFYYVVGLSSSQEIRTALNMTLAFASNTRIFFIIQIHMQLQSLKQGYLSINQFLHKVKIPFWWAHCRMLTTFTSIF